MELFDLCSLTRDIVKMVPCFFAEWFLAIEHPKAHFNLNVCFAIVSNYEKQAWEAAQWRIFFSINLDVLSALSEAKNILVKIRLWNGVSS